jgi:hypothetical protein
LSNHPTTTVNSQPLAGLPIPPMSKALEVNPASIANEQTVPLFDPIPTS